MTQQTAGSRSGEDDAQRTRRSGCACRWSWLLCDRSRLCCCGQVAGACADAELLQTHGAAFGSFDGGDCCVARGLGHSSSRWSARNVDLKRIVAIALVLLACGVLLTFPPIGDLF